MTFLRILAGFLSILIVQQSCLESLGSNAARPDRFDETGNSLVTAGTPQPNTPVPTAVGQSTAASIPPREAALSQTYTQALIPSGTPTVIFTSTETSAPPCLVPLMPPDGTSFDSYGKISFTWESNIDAASYSVSVSMPNNSAMAFPSKTTSYSRWIESFPWGGRYYWRVFAYNKNGETMCTSKSMKFTKLITLPTSTATPPVDDPESD